MKLAISTVTLMGAVLVASVASAQTAPAAAGTAPAAAGTTPASATRTSSTTTTTATEPAIAPAAPATTTSGILSVQQPTTSVQDLPTTEERKAVNKPLLTTGAVFLVGSYAAAAGAGYASSRPEDQHNLYYPVVGPWMDLANRDTNTRPGKLETLNKVLLIADGVGQGLGALAVVTSFFVGEKATRHWYLIGSNKVEAGPTPVGSGYGLGAMGQF